MSEGKDVSDRLTHHCEILKTGNESCALRTAPEHRTARAH